MNLTAKTGVALTITALSLVVTVGAGASEPPITRKRTHSSTSGSFPQMPPTSALPTPPITRKRTHSSTSGSFPQMRPTST